jgi:hypothetical protein
MYTFAFDGEQKTLASFTPSGRGCCYYDNGVVRFLATEEGGTVADEAGAIVRRWNWPEGPGRLKEPVVVQLNSALTLKCFGQGGMSLAFCCQKENIRVPLSCVPSAEKEDNSQVSRS